MEKRVDSRYHSEVVNTLIKRFLQKFRPAPKNVIVVGTDYPSYQLGSLIQAEPALNLAFFMNEEPWHHRTFILGTELRYSSELLSLVEKHQVKAVYCVTEADFADYQQRFSQALSQLSCKLVLCDDGNLPALN